MQNSDGNLVLYATNGQAVWAANTAGHPGAWLAVQNDSNVVVYPPSGAALWNTGCRNSTATGGQQLTRIGTAIGQRAVRAHHAGRWQFRAVRRLARAMVHGNSR